MAVTEITDETEIELRSAVVQFPELAEVVESIDAADAAVSEVERRIVAGDDEVGLGDLEEAEKSSRLARLQARRAKSKAERDAEARRLARIEELRADLCRRFPEMQGRVLDEFEVARQAVTDLVAAIGDHNAQLREVIAELVTLGPLPGDLNPNSGSTSGSARLVVDEVSVNVIDPAHFLDEAAWSALTAIGDSRAAGKFGQYNSRDRHASTVYGVPDEANGSAGVVTPSIVLAHNAARLGGNG